MPFMPKVSIVIPVFNGSDYLSEAVESALDQTYENTEIIVINDGSQDKGATENIALSYGNKIRYFSKENGGVASALNLAMEKMTGEYFSWLSHDDLYLPGKLEIQIMALADMDTSRTIMYSDYAIFSHDANKVQEVKLPRTPPEKFRYFITVNNSMHGCTLLVPRTAFDQCGIFNKALRTTQDYDLWFRMAKKYQFVHIPEVLVKARIHEEQGSKRMRDIAVAECDELLMGFVAQLQEEDLSSSKGAPISLSYIQVATNFRERGFYQAEKKALSLALYNLCQCSPLDALRTVFRLLYVAVFGTVISILRGLIINFRLKVRRWSISE